MLTCAKGEDMARFCTVALSVAVPLAAIASSVLAKPAAAPAAVQPLTCTAPVGPRDSAATLLTRFRGLARIQTINGPEGEELRGVVIYPADPRRRLEVLFHDEAMRKPATVRFYHEQARWSVAGLRIGDPMNKVTQVNGRPFDLFGFEWDYGGQVTDWRGGTLKALPGGCNLSVGLNSRSETTPESVLGDKTIRSDLAVLRRLDVRVGRLSIGWPE